MGIPYEADKVQQHLIDAGVWPGGFADTPGVTPARHWWVSLLKQVTYTVNDHPWDETDDMNDAIREITDIAVDQVLGAAYVNKMIMPLLELSGVHDLDIADEVELHLHSVIFADPTAGMSPHSGESYDHPDYLERLARARDKHNDQVAELLGLRAFNKIYLMSAAVTVARPWCEAQVKRYLTQWRCEACDDTFPAEDQADGEECEAAECAVHDDEDNCDDHDCSFPHSLIRNDTE